MKIQVLNNAENRVDISTFEDLKKIRDAGTDQQRIEAASNDLRNGYLLNSYGPEISKIIDPTEWARAEMQIEDPVRFAAAKIAGRLDEEAAVFWINIRLAMISNRLKDLEVKPN